MMCGPAGPCNPCGALQSLQSLQSYAIPADLAGPAVALRALQTLRALVHDHHYETTIHMVGETTILAEVTWSSSCQVMALVGLRVVRVVILDVDEKIARAALLEETHQGGPERVLIRGGDLLSRRRERRTQSQRRASERGDGC